MSKTAQIGPNTFDLDQALPISIPFQSGPDQVNCYYAPPFSTSPVVMGDFVGDIRSGSPVNYLNMQVNPHGNGTHTECLAHISDLDIDIHSSLQDVHVTAQVISLTPTTEDDGDQIIRLHTDLILPEVEALVIRTLPNPAEKRHRAYSGTNPPYLAAESAAMIREAGINHLLIDLPSLDKEVDGGALAAHRAFWNYPEAPRIHATITELIYVSDAIVDGIYLLNLQCAPFHTDASPSRPVLFPLQKNNPD